MRKKDFPLHLSILVFPHSNFSMQEEITCVGRICCDSMGKLNAKSMLIEGTKRISNGERVNFDVSEVGSFSSFPGQVSPQNFN